MALKITHPEAERLARELAATTGETVTEALVNALKERLRRERGRLRGPRLRDERRAIRQRCGALPVLDSREPDDIIGYDKHGAPR